MRHDWQNRKVHTFDETRLLLKDVDVPMYTYFLNIYITFPNTHTHTHISIHIKPRVCHKLIKKYKKKKHTHSSLCVVPQCLCFWPYCGVCLSFSLVFGRDATNNLRLRNVCVYLTLVSVCGCVRCHFIIVWFPLCVNSSSHFAPVVFSNYFSINKTKHSFYQRSISNPTK